MKKLLLPLFVMCILLMSCNKTQKQLQEKIINSDSVAINFFKGDGTMDTVIAVKLIRDKAVMEKLTGFITSASTAIKNDCGNDGSIHYFKNNMVIQDINFRMNNNDCKQFSFKLDGKYVATKLSAEAKEFISGLKK